MPPERSADPRVQRFVDPRGQRFAAAVTTLVLATVLLTGAGWLAAAQAVVFGIGAVDVTRAPYGLLFRYAVRPRLGPPAERETAAGPQFAQLVGFVMAALAALGYLAGVPALGPGATCLALAAAFLNAAFGVCLGCEAHVVLLRALHRPGQPRYVPVPPPASPATRIVR